MANKDIPNYKLIVIGAGPSGLLCAYKAAKSGINTLILERNNEAAKKIYATGNGHCNYLNKNALDANLLEKELKEIGIEAVEEEDGRLYPRSKEASFVAECLISAAVNASASLLCDCHITDVQKKDQGFMVISKDGRKFCCEKLCIATGGKAGIQFGCYGEGYRWAQYLGHSLVKPVPALVAMECEENIEKLHGVRTKLKATVLKNNEEIAFDSGEVQFTKDSISGICVMNLSRYIRLEENTKYVLSLDLFPELSVDELKNILVGRSSKFDNPLKGLVPDKLAEYIAERTTDIATECKNLHFSVMGTKGWAQAQVSSGGVPLTEINQNTMESTIVPGLYFIGELLDYDGPCGGYNLSFAFRSALLAGNAICQAGQ